jgi:hypothetical protein
VVTRYLTYTFGPISITFFQPFLDDTSRTHAVLSPKKSQLERGPNFPRGGLGMPGIAQRVLKIVVEKGLKSILNPPLSQK